MKTYIFKNWVWMEQIGMIQKYKCKNDVIFNQI